MIPSWIHINKVSGVSGETLVDIVADENMTMSARTYTLTITGGSGSNTASTQVVINQERYVDGVHIAPSALTLNGRGGTNEINILSYYDWEVVSSPDWVEVTNVTPSGFTLYTSTYSEYETSVRTGEIVIRNSQGEENTLTVTQNSLIIEGDLFLVYDVTSNTKSTQLFSSVWTLDNGAAAVLQMRVNEGEWHSIRKDITGYTFNTLGDNIVEFKIADELKKPNEFAIFNSNLYRKFANTSLKKFRVNNRTVNYVEIPMAAFEDATFLSEFTIPSTVVRAGFASFYGCSNLKTITIENGVQELNYGATNPSGFFGRCYSLKEVTIPDSVTSIGASTFADCTGLTAVTIGSGITPGGMSIRIAPFNYSQNFMGCSSLREITIKAPIAPGLAENSFARIPNEGTLHYPSGSDYSLWLEYLPSGWVGVPDA